MQSKQPLTTKLSTAIGAQRQTRYKSTHEERDNPLGVTHRTQRNSNLSYNMRPPDTESLIRNLARDHLKKNTELQRQPAAIRRSDDSYHMEHKKKLALDSNSRFSQFDEVNSKPMAPQVPAKRKLQQTQQNFLHLAQYDP